MSSLSPKIPTVLGSKPDTSQVSKGDSFHYHRDLQAQNPEEPTGYIPCLPCPKMSTQMAKGPIWDDPQPGFLKL